jgi:hypothetical protein
VSDWIPFDYAVLRLVPQVHREQFVNIGVLVHARTEERLLARICPDWHRLEALGALPSRAEIEHQIEALLAIARGGENAGPIGLLPPSERFHWLTAPKSAVLQSSAIKTGRTRDLDQVVEQLFEEQCG